MGELLAPYRILDLTDERGMLCGKLLADLGADVILIERPGGSTARLKGHFYHDVMDPNKSLLFFAFNANKRSTTLNIETADGKDIFKRMVKGADIVIESFEPGYLDEIGLGYSVLSEIKPSLVMTSISGFGGTGPYAHYKAPDLVVAATGLIMSVTGEPGGRPVRMSVPQSYAQACLQAALGTMIAHYYRLQTGEGQHVDVSAMESLFWLIGEYIPRWFADMQIPSFPGRDFIGGRGERYPFMWECKDGDITFVLIGGVHGALANEQLAEWMDAEGMLPEEWRGRDWSQLDFNIINQEELDHHTAVVSEFFERHTRQELWEESQKRGIWIYPASNMKDLMENPQLKERGFWVPIHHDELDDTVTYPGPFAVFSETPIGEWRRAPLIGEHNEEIYEREMGFSKEDLVVLAEAGVI